MPYKANGRYTWKGRKYRKHLSTRNIFAHKGSKAQAKQIYALRKSIKKVAKMCKPEVKVVESNINIDEFTATTSGDEPTIVNNMWRRYDVALPPAGVNDSEKIGNVITMLPITWFINAQYGRKTHSSNGIPFYNMVDGGTGACMRIVVVQSKQAMQTAPRPADFFPLFEDYAAWQTTITNMNCPYRNGITSNWNIIYDKVKYINENRPIYNKRLKIKPVDRHVVWEQGYNYPKGTVWMFVLCAGLRTTGNNLNQADYDYIAFNQHTTLPYTDA